MITIRMAIMVMMIVVLAISVMVMIMMMTIMIMIHSFKHTFQKLSMLEMSLNVLSVPSLVSKKRSLITFV